MSTNAEIMLYLLRCLRDMKHPPRREALVKMVAEDLQVTEEQVVEAIKEAKPALDEYVRRPE